MSDSFRELVEVISSQPEDQSIEESVMKQRVCESEAPNQVHDTVKVVYMEALIACDSRQCIQQLHKTIDSHELDSGRASHYKTRFAGASADKTLEQSDRPTEDEADDDQKTLGSDESEAQVTSGRNDDGHATLCATSNGADPSKFEPPLYTESHRPQIHYSPSSGFMNDPNGLVRSGDGTWHMYFQYNPHAPTVGNQHWGHATSKDLYRWQNHKPALTPTAGGAEGEAIFSGSAVLDVNNTSGLFDESTPPGQRFVAIYTLETPTDQNQNIAYSSDGQNYIKYEGNPVISLGTRQFRDPKVFWDARSSQWVMVVAHPHDFQVGFYGSPDLKSWSELSRFGPAGILGYQYECPELLRVPVEGGQRHGLEVWLLVLSINPGSPLGGSTVQYFIGHWDGREFVADDGVARWADFGKDWYAAQSFHNAPDNKAIAIGWASNWQYTNDVPTAPYRGVMSTPRELKLVWSQLNPKTWAYQLAQQPYNLDSLPARELDWSATDRTLALEGEGAFEIRARFSVPKSGLSKDEAAPGPSVEFEIRDSSRNGLLKVGFIFGEPVVIYVDRRFAGRKFADTNPFFTDRFSQQVAPIYRSSKGTATNSSSSSSSGDDEDVDHIVEIQLIIDRTITEVFAQGGLASAVVLTYWDDDSRPASVSLSLGSSAVKIESAQVKAIDGTWPTCP